MVIDVPADMSAANLALAFPDSLRLEGLEDMPQVTWDLDLVRGANVLTLPVTVSAGTNLAEELSIQAMVSYGEQRRVFELPVELLVRGEGQQGAGGHPGQAPMYRI